LEALARALLTVLLSLMCASVARKKSELLELTSQLGVKFDQRARDAQARGAGLSADSTTLRKDDDIEALCGFSGEQRLAYVGAGRLAYKVILKGAVINGDLALTGSQKNPDSRSLAAAGSQLLH